MQFIFFLSSFTLLISILFIIFVNDLLYSTLLLIISFLSTSVIFFLLGSYLAGFFQVIIYSGAILLLFVFIIMMIDKKDNFFIINLDIKNFINFFLLFLVSSIFFIDITYSVLKYFNITQLSEIVDMKRVGKILFSDYFFVVELSSMLLLESLIISFYLNKNYKDIK
ncbi:NADH-quinone oxidoreductase subunit J [Buchnera aphidicola (Ceratovacuna keduensis)]|uniref:NADH-quinone oxidoreductase subunit J n=1 Tax=Buchnera aphidicola TaxID=9 RepID=UPI0031B85DC5